MFVKFLTMCFTNQSSTYQEDLLRPLHKCWFSPFTLNQTGKTGQTNPTEDSLRSQHLDCILDVDVCWATMKDHLHNNCGSRTVLICVPKLKEKREEKKRRSQINGQRMEHTQNMPSNFYLGSATETGRLVKLKNQNIAVYLHVERGSEIQSQVLSLETCGVAR